MRILTRITVLAIVLLAAYATAAYAVMYKYVDEDGNVVLSDDRESIPKEYRNSIEVIEEPSAPDGFAPEGDLADEIRQRRKAGGSGGQSESSDARWYKESPDIEPSVVKRFLFYIKDLWHKIPFAQVWPAIAAALWVIISFVVSRFIVGRDQRRLMLFFSLLAAAAFLLVMYAWILK